MISVRFTSVELRGPCHDGQPRTASVLETGSGGAGLPLLPTQALLSGRRMLESGRDGATAIVNHGLHGKQNG